MAIEGVERAEGQEKMLTGRRRWWLHFPGFPAALWAELCEGVAAGEGQPFESLLFPKV